MLISGFSFIRNGDKFNYPYIESIKSSLPICDEFVIAVGNSEDDTRGNILSLNEPKIKIIDTIWDETLRVGGRILAQQTNIALDNVKGKWAFYIQGDEVIHENDLVEIKSAAEKYQDNDLVDGLLFSYLHFFGNYNFIRDRYSKRAYPVEIRLIKNNLLIRSYRDAQGFRKFPSIEDYQNGHEGTKLNVVKIDATVFHYGMVRRPEKEIERQKEFNKFWHSDEKVEERLGEKTIYHYSGEEALEPFTGTHPAVMRERIANQNWNFDYESNHLKEKLRYKLARRLGRLFGKRFFDYKNYNVIKS